MFEIAPYLQQEHECEKRAEAPDETGVEEDLPAGGRVGVDPLPCDEIREGAETEAEDEVGQVVDEDELVHSARAEDFPEGARKAPREEAEPESDHNVREKQLVLLGARGEQREHEAVQVPPEASAEREHREHERALPHPFGDPMAHTGAASAY